MNDLISRQAAIDAIETWGLIDGLSEGQAIEILADEEKVPSARQAHSEGLYVDGYNNGYRDGIKDAQPEGELDQAGLRMGQDGLSDCISRQAAIEELGKGAWGVEWDKTLAKTMIESLPSAQPERKKGRWIPQDYNQRHGNINTTVYYYPKCSVCGCSGDYTDAFCKSCGADMRGGAHED